MTDDTSAIEALARWLEGSVRRNHTPREWAEDVLDMAVADPEASRVVAEALMPNDVYVRYNISLVARNAAICDENERLCETLDDIATGTEIDRLRAEVAALREAAQEAVDWMDQKCWPRGAEYASEGHGVAMSGDEVGRAVRVRDALIAALDPKP